MATTAPRKGASPISTEGHEERLSEVAREKKAAGPPKPARRRSTAKSPGSKPVASGSKSSRRRSSGAAKGSANGSASSNGRARTAGKSKDVDTPKTPTGKAKAKQTAKKAAGKTMEVAGKTADVVKGEGSSAVPKPNKLARKLATTAAKKMASKMLEAGAERLRRVIDLAAETGHVAVEKTAHQRLPIQVGVDVAVPIIVAWDEWMALECLPEGVHNVTDIERDGDVLVGRADNRRGKEWEAEILDEREAESFAWRSYEGSDCAGLATFHELSDRLTRIELDLDVVPTSVPDTFELALHLADKHAEAYLRRLKARLEFLNPDEYEDEVHEYWKQRRNGQHANGSAPDEDQSDSAEEEEAAQA